VPGGDLDIPQVHARIQHGRDEGMTEHVRVRSGNPYPGGPRKPPQPTGGGMAVHPCAAAVQQDRPAGARADRSVDGPADGGWQRDQDHLGAFPAHAQDPVAVFFAESVMSAQVASKIRKPSSPSMATRAKSHGFGD
jgi:hypothetical protein